MRHKYEQNHNLQNSRNQRFHLPQDGSGQGKTSRLTFWIFGPFARTPKDSSPLTNRAVKNFYPTQGGYTHGSGSATSRPAPLTAAGSARPDPAAPHTKPTRESPARTGMAASSSPAPQFPPAGPAAAAASLRSHRRHGAPAAPLPQKGSAAGHAALL